jgi:hypothetical protein
MERREVRTLTMRIYNVRRARGVEPSKRAYGMSRNAMKSSSTSSMLKEQMNDCEQSPWEELNAHDVHC